MRWLVDGYNVIRRDPDLRAHEAEGLSAARAALLALLARVAAASTERFTVIFDGARRESGAPSGGRVEVLFSRPPDTADDVLRRQAAALRAGAVVITSDRSVGDTVRRAGAVAVTAEAFLAAVRGRSVEVGDEDDEGVRVDRRGPSHRPSREARNAERALRRLPKLG